VYDDKPENNESEMSPRDALEQAMGEGDVDAVLSKLKELGFHLMANTEMPSQDSKAETAKTGEPDEMDEDEDEDMGGMGGMFASGLEKLRGKAMKAVKDKYGDF
jgi:hypothetical protein